MPFQIIRNDITKVKADAIVNTANPKPVIGSGTDSAIYTAAGEKKLLAARKKIGELKPGQAVQTPAFALKAKYIIHTVGAIWIDGKSGEKDTLLACYENSLALAERLKCESIAFPLISGGAYRFPKDEALNTALSAIGKFLLTHEMQITLVVFDQKSFELSSALMGDIEQFIDENAAESIRQEESGYISRSIRAERMYNLASASQQFPEFSGRNLSEVVGSADSSFQTRLFELIDQSGMDDVTVYKKANIDRKLFSQIRCKKNYKPKKRTALALAIALELDLPTTEDLLARAELAISRSNRFDLIIAYFITNKNYDIFEINAALFRYGQPTLGV